MHAVNILEDSIGMGRNGNRRSLVERAMRRIGREGRGVIVLIRDVREGAIMSRLTDPGAPSPDGKPARETSRRLRHRRADPA